jgi:lipoprotein NlpI
LIIAVILTVGLAACLGLSDADKRYNSGVMLFDEDRFEEAIAEFDLALLLDGSMAEAFHNRALAE